MSLPTASGSASPSGQTPTGAEIHDLKDRGVTDRVPVPRNVWRDAIALAEVEGLGGKRMRVAQTLAQLLEATGAPSRAITREEIADKTPSGPSVKTVDRAVEALEAAGWLHVIHRRGGGGVCGRGNVYRLTIPHTHPWASEWIEDDQADRLDRARGERGYRKHNRNRRAAARTRWRQWDTPDPSTPNPGVRGEQSSPAREDARAKRSQQVPDESSGEVGAGDEVERRVEKSARSAVPATSEAETAAEEVAEDLEKLLKAVPAPQRAACRPHRSLLAQLRRALRAGWTAEEIREQALESASWPPVVISPGGLVRKRIKLLLEQQEPPKRRPRPPVVGEEAEPLDEPIQIPVVVVEPEDPCPECEGRRVVEISPTTWGPCPECGTDPGPTISGGSEPQSVGEVVVDAVDRFSRT